MILVGIKVFVDRGIRFLYLGMSSAIERHVEILRQVPTQGELTIPQELLIEYQWQLRTAQVFHVSFLLLGVDT